MRRVIVIVLDSVGVGALPDWQQFDEIPGDTLVHVAHNVGGLALPHLGELGLGNIVSIEGVSPTASPKAAFGRSMTRSAGKDTITGHWEMMGILTEQPFPLYPHGFPADLVAGFERIFQTPILGNKPASGTEIIEEYGEEHLASGYPIVYTSGDSVVQIACHESIIDHTSLYAFCKRVRELCQGKHGVGRVIARPFEGEPGHFVRNGYRKDFPLEPADDNYLKALSDAGQMLCAIGKIADIFHGRYFDVSYPEKGNERCLSKTLDVLDTLESGLLFVNLVDFDMLYGHRNDVAGYAKALEDFDRALPAIISRLQPDDLLIITADHGNDPTIGGTDHNREYVPVLSYRQGQAGYDLNTLTTLADIGSSCYSFLTKQQKGPGKSFLKE